MPGRRAFLAEELCRTEGKPKLGNADIGGEIGQVITGPEITGPYNY